MSVPWISLLELPVPIEIAIGIGIDRPLDPDCDPDFDFDVPDQHGFDQGRSRKAHVREEARARFCNVCPPSPSAGFVT
jgi:hypothetical protein